MAQPRMNVALSEDRAVLALLPGRGTKGRLGLTLDQYLESISGLEVARAQLIAELPADPRERELESTGVQAIVGPAWMWRAEVPTEGPMLASACPTYETPRLMLLATRAEEGMRALTSHLEMAHPRKTG